MTLPSGIVDLYRICAAPAVTLASSAASASALIPSSLVSLVRSFWSESRSASCVMTTHYARVMTFARGSMMATGLIARKRAAAVTGAGVRAASQVVVSYCTSDDYDARSHESVTRMKLAEKLAALKGCSFGGEF